MGRLFFLLTTWFSTEDGGREDSLERAEELREKGRRGPAPAPAPGAEVAAEEDLVGSMLVLSALAVAAAGIALVACSLDC